AIHMAAARLHDSVRVDFLGRAARHRRRCLRAIPARALHGRDEPQAARLRPFARDVYLRDYRVPHVQYRGTAVPARCAMAAAGAAGPARGRRVATVPATAATVTAASVVTAPGVVIAATTVIAAPTVVVATVVVAVVVDAATGVAGAAVCVAVAG